MKTIKILPVIFAMCLLPLSAILTGCTQSHEATTSYDFNTTHHWYECSCSDDKCTKEYDKELHNFELIETNDVGNTTTVTLACDCGATKTQTINHTAGAFAHDETHHWQICTCQTIDCNRIFNKEVHSFELVDEDVTSTKTIISYECECKKTKQEETQTQEQMFNLFVTISACYENPTTTARTFKSDYPDAVRMGTVNLETYECAYLESTDEYYVVIKNGANYQLFEVEYATGERTLRDITVSTARNWALEVANSLRMNSLEGQLSYEDTLEIYPSLEIVKENGIYTMKENNHILATFSDTYLLSMTYEYSAGGYETITFSESFDRDFYNTFDTTID